MSHKKYQGRIYSNGKALDLNTRKEIVDLHVEGFPYREISKRTGVTKPGCLKIVKNFESTNSLAPNIQETPGTKKVTDEVLAFVEYQKTTTPSIYCREIRKNLLNNNISGTVCACLD